jgi:hypothetical protein
MIDPKPRIEFEAVAADAGIMTDGTAVLSFVVSGPQDVSIFLSRDEAAGLYERIGRELKRVPKSAVKR